MLKEGDVCFDRGRTRSATHRARSGAKKSHHGSHKETRDLSMRARENKTKTVKAQEAQSLSHYCNN